MQLSAQLFSEVLELLRIRGEDQGNERRRFTRIQVCAKVQAARLVEDGRVRKYSALTRDVSSDGLGLLQHFPLNSGDRIIIELPRKRDGSVNVICEARFCRPLAEELYGIGMRFDSVANEDSVKTIWTEAVTELDRIKQSIMS